MAQYMFAFLNMTSYDVIATMVTKLLMLAKTQGQEDLANKMCIN